MKILITGICGFVGSTLAKSLLEQHSGLQIIGLDNFIRPGSEMNRPPLKELGVKIHYGDIRNASDLESLPAVDFVVDAAANPSVLAGVDGKTSSLQLIGVTTEQHQTGQSRPMGPWIAARFHLAWQAAAETSHNCNDIQCPAAEERDPGVDPEPVRCWFESTEN